MNYISRGPRTLKWRNQGDVWEFLALRIGRGEPRLVFAKPTRRDLLDAAGCAKDSPLGGNSKTRMRPPFVLPNVPSRVAVLTYADYIFTKPLSRYFPKCALTYGLVNYRTSARRRSLALTCVVWPRPHHHSPTLSAFALYLDHPGDHPQGLSQSANSRYIATSMSCVLRYPAPFLSPESRPRPERPNPYWVPICNRLGGF